MTVDLSDREADFADSEEEKARNFDPLPDGKYVVEVTEAKVQNKGGHDMLTWTMKVIEGEHSGRLLWRNNMLETKANFGWLKRDLGVCGVTLMKLNDINDRANDLVGIVLEVQQKTTGKYSNVYINRVVAAGTEVHSNKSNDANDGQRTQAEEDNIPF